MTFHKIWYITKYDISQNMKFHKIWNVSKIKSQKYEMSKSQDGLKRTWNGLKMDLRLTQGRLEMDLKWKIGLKKCHKILNGTKYEILQNMTFHK